MTAGFSKRHFRADHARKEMPVYCARVKNIPRKT